MATECLSLLAEGRFDFTLADVASRSGVSRTTVYRWWPTPTDLMREALAFHVRDLTSPNTGTWTGDVHALVAQLADFFSDPVELAQNSIIAGGQHPELSGFLIESFLPVLAEWEQMVRRAIDRGEVSAESDPATVIRMLVSPLLLVTVMERRAPTDQETAQIAAAILRATRT